MTSFRRIDANRRNARLSTGPVTEEGQEKVASAPANALVWPAKRSIHIRCDGQAKHPGAPLMETDKHTYGRILKSSALIGGSSVLNIGIGILHTKAMAVLLGPAGLGLMGLYGSIIDLAVSIAGMSIS